MARYRIFSKKSRNQLARKRRMRIFVLFTLWQAYQVQRDMWMHPMNVERPLKGEFHTLYKDQRKYPDRFFENYRMSVDQFDFLLRLVTPLLQGVGSNFRESISAEQKLVLTLR